MSEERLAPYRLDIEQIGLFNEQRQYAEALRHSEAILRSRSIGTDRQILADLFFEIAYSHYFLGNFAAARLKLKVAIRLCERSANLESLGKFRNLSGLILQQMGRLSDATEEHLQSYVFRRQFRQFDQLAHSLVNLGLTHLVRGNLREALEQFERALENAQRYNGIQIQVVCQLNRLIPLLLMGEFRKFASEVELLRTSPTNEDTLLRIEYRSGMLNVWRRENQMAERHLQTALRGFSKTGDARFVAVCLEYLGLNEYFAGNYAKAREYYDQVLAMPEPTASAVAQTLRMLTDVEIAEGNWEAARTTAAKADVAINKISERIELGALWRAYGHICAHDSDHARAREYFEKSIDLLRQLGARYELALSYFDAGRSKAYSHDQQNEHLKAAKALFVEMEVPKRVAQVDEALKTIAGQETIDSGKSRRSLTIKNTIAAPVVVAVSRSMTAIMEMVEQIKNSELSIMITGETGTGKDLLAEYIHYTGNRAGKPFKAINCAAIPENLLELELFGVKKGTFTGSNWDKPGLIESADGGTFYFDEIGDAPAAIQSKLLRVIETKTVRRLGSNEDVRVDVRFIAATNHNLQERIAAKEFRRDLYYRLAEVDIMLPPLRERREDVMPLISQFLRAEEVELTTEQYSQLDSRVNGYDWPGNVREVRRLVKLATATAAKGDLIPALENALDLLNDSAIPQAKAALIELLVRHNWNIAGAARELGIPRTTLVSQLKRFGLL